MAALDAQLMPYGILNVFHHSEGNQGEDTKWLRYLFSSCCAFTVFQLLGVLHERPGMLSEGSFQVSLLASEIFLL